MKLFVSIFSDARLLPHVLRHYLRLGIDEFHVAAPPNMADEVARASRGYDVRQHNDLDVADSVIGGASAVTTMRERAQGSDEWIVIIDLDEFVEFPAPVGAIAAKAEAEGANVVRGIMFDRFAIDGQPKPFDEHTDLRALFPVKARFISVVMSGVDFKGVLVKGHLKSAGAHHLFHDERPYSQIFEISHYKWFDRSLERLKAAYDMALAARTGWENQYKTVLEHYERHGRFAWETFGGEIAGPVRRELMFRAPFGQQPWTPATTCAGPGV